LFETRACSRSNLLTMHVLKRKRSVTTTCSPGPSVSVCQGNLARLTILLISSSIACQGFRVQSVPRKARSGSGRKRSPLQTAIATKEITQTSSPSLVNQLKPRTDPEKGKHDQVLMALQRNQVESALNSVNQAQLLELLSEQYLYPPPAAQNNNILQTAAAVAVLPAFLGQ
jgi:hypothetical protein